MAKKGAKHTHLKLTLVENGIDFVRSGIERYFLRDAPSPRDHKYAVLHVFAGVLLLLRRHKGDLASMATLLRVMGEARGELATLSAQMAAATRSESG